MAYSFEICRSGLEIINFLNQTKMPKEDIISILPYGNRYIIIYKN